MTFAAQLVAHRKRLHLSQKQAAALFVGHAGEPLLHTATWQQWEYDRREPIALVQHFVLRHLAAQQPQEGGSFEKRGRPPLKAD